MKKSIFSVLIALLLVLSLLSVLPVSVSAGQEGTAVSTAAEFEAMVSGEKYYLTQDIDLQGKVYRSYIFEEFSGTIDGNGHTVFNFSIDGTGSGTDAGMILRANKIADLYISDLNIGSADWLVELTSDAAGKSFGLIAGAQQDAHSATLTNVNVYGDIKITGEGKCNTGGFIGYSRAVTFVNCKMYGKVTVGSGPDKLDEVYHNAGGFIASCNSNSTTFENCENHAAITCYPTSVEARAAGFVTYTANSVIFTNCANYGEITVLDHPNEKSDSQAGGFVAHANKTSPVMLDKCTNYGKVNCSRICGGMVAYVVSGVFYSDCVNEGAYNKEAAYPGCWGGMIADGATITFENCEDKTDPNSGDRKSVV